MRSAWWIILLGLISSQLTGCGNDEATPQSRVGKPHVCTTFYPLTFAVERIAGDLVDLVCVAQTLVRARSCEVVRVQEALQRGARRQK